MDERELSNQLREKVKYLELQNEKLEKIILKRFHEFEKAKDHLEEQVVERTLHLKEQKEQLQAIIENIPGVVFQFYVSNTGEAGAHYVSPKMFEIFGLEAIADSALFLQKFVQNIHEEDRKSWKDSIQEVVEKQIPWKWKGRYVKPSGKIIWFEGQSISTVRKNEIVFDGIFIDITKKIEQEAKRLETALQQEQLKKDESLKTMAGAIAHRFNNAMMAVQGNLEILTLILPADSKEYSMASDAAQAARGASQVGSMMLSYVGQQPLKIQEFSFEALVRASVSTLKSILQPSISLQFTPPDQPLYCSMDLNQIKEVMENVLTNAVESLNSNEGTLEISFGTEYYKASSFPLPFQGEKVKDGMYAFCQMKDTGHGISPENLLRIFEPFYTTRFVGRGLGLALTVGIMRAHYGAITVESAPRMGTTVRVLLPSRQSRQQAIPSSDTVQSETVQFSGDILLADDETIILDVGREMLELLGFTVHTAVNGQEAVDKVRKRDIDFCAAVLDISMPKMDGIQAMREIRGIDSAIPVLLSSGYSEDDFSFKEAPESKPDGFLEKPFQLSDIRSSLERLLF